MGIGKTRGPETCQHRKTLQNKPQHFCASWLFLCSLVETDAKYATQRPSNQQVAHLLVSLRRYPKGKPGVLHDLRPDGRAPRSNSDSSLLRQNPGPNARDTSSR